MRPFLFATAPLLALFAVLPAAAVAQASGECEYRNPDNPQWNYLRSCTVRSDTSGARLTITANVANGSTITIVEEGAAGALRFEVNGHAATRIEGGASRCYLTTEDEETICVRVDDAGLAPADPTPAAASADEPGAPPATGIDAAFGGGEAGHCLAWADDPAREGLIGHGPCMRRIDCAEVEGEGGMSCLTDFIWDNGTETVVTSRGEVYTLDGAVAVPRDAGCFADEEAGLHFCFSTAAMTEAAYPALALPPAPVPEHVTTAAAAADHGPAAAPEGNRCSFLRGEIEVSSWSCTETVACDAPLCTVSYAFENGTTVTLDTADGQVMLMNGAKADPAPWAAGAVVDVTRPGAPYTFRFTPGVPAASAQ